MSTGRVLFYVQHLLGIGHLRRAAVLARAMKAAGLEVLVVSCGEPVPVIGFDDLRVAQLPPARAADESFKILLDAEGRQVSEAWKAARREALLAVFRRFAPAVIVLELFPLGRRQMRFELVPLLHAARARRPRPWIVSSVRDILVQKTKAARAPEFVSLARELVDVVLVHSDPALVRLTDSLPQAAALADRVRYTGYVVEPSAAVGGTAARGEEVLVSAGGGAVGETLLATAIAARPLTVLADAPWRVLAGHNLSADGFAALRRAAPEGVTVERARPDFPALLCRCRLSVSQAGYNTLIEVLASDTPAVVVPFESGEETEQATRAALVAERGWVQVVRGRELSPESLARAIDRAAGTPRRGRLPLRLDGARVSAGIVSRLAASPATIEAGLGARPDLT